MNYNRQGKLRRLWRLAVATHPPIVEHQSAAVSRGDTYPSETHCKLRRSAAVGKQRRSHSLLVPRSGTYVLSLISSWICQSRFAELFVEGGCRSYPQLRCFAACSGFLMEGPAPRNPQLILNLLVVRGCVAMPCKYRTKSKNMLQNKN